MTSCSGWFVAVPLSGAVISGGTGGASCTVKGVSRDEALPSTSPASRRSRCGPSGTPSRDQAALQPSAGSWSTWIDTPSTRKRTKATPVASSAAAPKVPSTPTTPSGAPSKVGAARVGPSRSGRGVPLTATTSRASPPDLLTVVTATQAGVSLVRPPTTVAVDDAGRVCAGVIPATEVKGASAV